MQAVRIFIAPATERWAIRLPGSYSVTSSRNSRRPIAFITIRPRRPTPIGAAGSSHSDSVTDAIHTGSLVRTDKNPNTASGGRSMKMLSSTRIVAPSSLGSQQPAVTVTGLDRSLIADTHLPAIGRRSGCDRRRSRS